LNAAALRSGLVNRVMLYLAPLLLGGQDAKSLIGGVSPGKLSGARRLAEVRTRRVGPDLLIEGIPTQRGGPRSVGKKG
jgi:diaminohydroxyphosphoribosylaminopyrimidine deaminase/5-amino-6-(5-phosphoribosylamino)uracil reductase